MLSVEFLGALQMDSNNIHVVTKVMLNIAASNVSSLTLQDTARGLNCFSVTLTCVKHYSVAVNYLTMTVNLMITDSTGD